jgi:ribosomal protein L11 methyltransferase
VSQYKALHLKCPQDLKDVLMAELSVLPFDTMEETPDGLSAYCLEEEWLESEVIEVMERYAINQYDVEKLEKKNWNALWENNYDPIKLNDHLAVRAPFHPPTGANEELIIVPKMSFGTGHHATTHLILSYLFDQQLEQKKILDVGCGTGILAIYALKKHASSVHCIDIDEWCIENSRENFTLNEIDTGFELELGTLQDITPRMYDIILANITRQVNLDNMADYAIRLPVDGTLVMSGFYERDVDDIVGEAQHHGFVFVDTETREQWARIVLRKA